MTDTVVGPIREFDLVKDGVTYKLKGNGILPLCYDCLALLEHGFNYRDGDHVVVCEECL